MYCFRILLVCLLAVSAASDALALVLNNNPNLTIAIVNEENTHCDYPAPRKRAWPCA